MLLPVFSCAGFTPPPPPPINPPIAKMQRKLITGALFRPDIVEWRGPTPYLITVEDALNLGVLTRGHQGEFPSSSNFISVMKTDNPLMFHDDFCAECDIPVLVGVGPLTDPHVRALSQRLCHQNGWTTKPSRWIRLHDIVQAGLLPTLLSLVTSNHTVDLHRPFGLDFSHALKVATNELPVLDIGQNVDNTGRCIHTDFLCSKGTANVTTDLFLESKWPRYSATFPPWIGKRTFLSPAAGFTAVTQGFQDAPMSTWMLRHWSDVIGIPWPNRQSTAPTLRFDTNIVSIGNELRGTKISDTTANVLETYEPRIYPFHETKFSNVPTKLAMLKVALDFPDVVSPVWSCDSVPGPGWRRNERVPPMIGDVTSNERYCWYNMIPSSPARH